MHTHNNIYIHTHIHTHTTYMQTHAYHCIYIHPFMPEAFFWCSFEISGCFIIEWPDLGGSAHKTDNLIVQSQFGTKTDLGACLFCFVFFPYVCEINTEISILSKKRPLKVVPLTDQRNFLGHLAILLQRYLQAFFIR